MNLIINGENKTFDNDITLQNILNKLKIEKKVMALAVNMQIIKRKNWNKYIPKDGDKLELLQFVGGG
jgi:sulfur carrier protein